MTKLLTYGQVADSLAVSPKTVRRLVAKRKLRAVKLSAGVVRFREIDVELLLKTSASFNP